MHERARAEHLNVPVFFFGHSMGSLLGRAYLLAHGDEVAGAILSATAWRAGPLEHVLRIVAHRESLKHGSRTPSLRMNRLVFGTFNLRFLPARTEFDWLSRDTTTVDEYIADPLCGFPCSGQLWADFFAGLSEVEKAEDDPSRLSRALPLLSPRQFPAKCVAPPSLYRRSIRGGGTALSPPRPYGLPIDSSSIGSPAAYSPRASWRARSSVSRSAGKKHSMRTSWSVMS